MLKMCGWTGDCYTVICAECLILVTENISIQINKIWEVMRFRETAGFFPPLFFDSSTVSTYFVEGEQNTAPLVNHFGMWDILS